jgi:WD40 repeat protein
MLVSCAVDKTVTIWDTYNATEKVSCGPPQPCGNKDMNVGKLYSINFYPSSPWLLGTAGSGKELALWDMARDTSIQKRFGDRVAKTVIEKTVEEPVDETSKQEAFNAMMAGETDPKPVELESKSKLKQKKGSKKKKAHRVGR